MKAAFFTLNPPHTHTGREGGSTTEWTWPGQRSQEPTPELHHMAPKESQPRRDSGLTLLRLQSPLLGEQVREEAQSRTEDSEPHPHRGVGFFCALPAGPKAGSQLPERRQREAENPTLTLGVEDKRVLQGLASYGAMGSWGADGLEALRTFGRIHSSASYRPSGPRVLGFKFLPQRVTALWDRGGGGGAHAVRAGCLLTPRPRSPRRTSQPPARPPRRCPSPATGARLPEGLSESVSPARTRAGHGAPAVTRAMGAGGRGLGRHRQSGPRCGEVTHVPRYTCPTTRRC